jgi:thiol-disulfide isomerase/thioredoxin
MRPPEFPRGMQWLNSLPLSFRTLQKRIVLIEFWTYSCVNCLRVLPYLARWYEKYAKLGFVVIGVHTPEFEFEERAENVRQAVAHLGIRFPVVLDPARKIWNLYQNAWWPRRIIVDTTGVIVFDHVGEGAYQETEETIRRLLRTQLRWPEDALGAPEPPAAIESGAVCLRTTPELYCGYRRGKIGTDDLLPDTPANYSDVVHAEADRWYLEGKWVSREEYVESVANGELAYARVRFSANSLNAVMASATGAEILLTVTLNDRSLTEANRGRDVEILPDGTSVVRVTAPRMYAIVASPEYLEASLKLFVRRKGLRIYAFTFGGCKPQELPEMAWQG